jgi:Ca2+-transporting ATPase
MIMDTLGALALATEPPNDDMMKRRPVGRGESFITKVMWRNIIGQSLYQLVVLGVLMFGGERLLNIKGADSKSVINTLIFNSFVFCQVRAFTITNTFTAVMPMVMLRSRSFQTISFCFQLQLIA